MVDLLISVILEALLEKYSIDGNHDWVVELDSSTEGTVLGVYDLCPLEFVTSLYF